jgi:hypothetical protein
VDAVTFRPQTLPDLPAEYKNTGQQFRGYPPFYTKKRRFSGRYNRAAQTSLYIYFFFYVSGYTAGFGQNGMSALRLEPVYFK